MKAKRLHLTGLFILGGLVTLKPSFELTSVRFIKPKSPVQDEVEPGEVFLVKDWPESTIAPKINGRRLTRLKNGKAWLGAAGLNSGDGVWVHAPGKLRSSGGWNASPVLAQYRKFVRIRRPKQERTAQLRLPAAVQQRVGDDYDTDKQKDAKKLKEIFSRSSSQVLSGCWREPVSSVIVSPFGSPRVLPSGEHYRHTGVDMRAWTNTPVAAAGNGVVAFADHMVIPGNTVILDHGQGWFSSYMHLREFKVKPGDQVTVGQIIGLSGTTGRSEAPHLHWEVLWRGTPVNPHSFVRTWAQICDSE